LLLQTLGRKDDQPNLFTRKVKDALLKGGVDAGNHLVELNNARLPTRPTKKMTAELIEVSKLSPEGLTSYFQWLAENHPSVYAALLGRALPQLMEDDEGNSGAMQLVYRTAEDVERLFREHGLPAPDKFLQLPKRIDLDNLEAIDVTPVKEK
jgi:hypothetical protein